MSVLKQAPSRAEAVELDQKESLNLRDEFRIPTKAEARSKALPTPGEIPNGGAVKDDDGASCTYLVGNSLGLQPKRTAPLIQQHLQTWATQGVQGHFKPLTGTPLPTWLDADDRAAGMMAPLVGARPAEVAAMQTLTANLHFLLSAFYRPDRAGRHKIILEAKAFPSDHFLVETQIRHHGLRTETSMVLIEPPPAAEDGEADPLLISTDHILSVIEEHAHETALLLLPGIQYYTGQLLDIPTITAAARRHGIFVVWDLAHAVGNVPLLLHDWDVDAAAWCTYKYLNAGPGSIGGLFVHERNSRVEEEQQQQQQQESTSKDHAGDESSEKEAGYRNRLSGWWGNDKKTRFVMATSRFRPVPGAAGFQVSNPSILDITSLCASLEVFGLAGGVGPLRERSLRLTGFLERLLDGLPAAVRQRFRIVTPRDPAQRGAQLSIMLVEDGVLEGVMEALEKRAIFVDDRKPNVIRVAPAPLYNTFEDCASFVEAFEAALRPS